MQQRAPVFSLQHDIQNLISRCEFILFLYHVQDTSDAQAEAAAAAEQHDAKDHGSRSGALAAAAVDRYCLQQ